MIRSLTREILQYMHLRKLYLDVFDMSQMSNILDHVSALYFESKPNRSCFTATKIHVHVFVDEPISHAQPSVGGILPMLPYLMMQWDWMGAGGGGSEVSWALDMAVINFIVIYTLRAEVISAENDTFDQLMLLT